MRPTSPNATRGPGTLLMSPCNFLMTSRCNFTKPSAPTSHEIRTEQVPRNLSNDRWDEEVVDGALLDR